MVETNTAPTTAGGEPVHATDAFYVSQPTRTTLFFRTFLPWQALRFVVINLKMMAIIRRSHRAERE